MPKIRIYELAKRLDKSNKEILDELARLGTEGKTHSSSIDDDIAQKVIDSFSSPTAAGKGPEKREEGTSAKPSESAAGQKSVEKPKPAPAGKKKKKEARKAPEGQSAELEGAAVVPPVVPDSEEDIALPDRFKKDIEAEKIEKFKSKPGLQRAFQAIRKIEPKKWHDVRGGRKGDRGK
jgi:translation initiation factor IF-2